MASNANKRSYRRGFLNDERGIAAFDCDIEIWHPTLSSITFKISDCNRQVALDFSYDGAEAKEKINNKIQRLIDELNNCKVEINAN
jgi:hypothetical protein